MQPDTLSEENGQNEGPAAEPWKSDAASPPAPQGAILMASVSVPGVHSCGNPHHLLVLGALGLSLCHGGGLGRLFLLNAWCQ